MRRRPTRYIREGTRRLDFRLPESLYRELKLVGAEHDLRFPAGVMERAAQELCARARRRREEILRTALAPTPPGCLPPTFGPDVAPAAQAHLAPASIRSTPATTAPRPAAPTPSAAPRLTPRPMPALPSAPQPPPKPWGRNTDPLLPPSTPDPPDPED